MLDYGLIHTWYSHTTHNSNVQWIFISFVWLYMFKCDMCMLNYLLIKPKIFFSVLFVFGSEYNDPCPYKFFSKSQIFFVEKLSVWQFHDSTHEWMHPIQVKSWNEEISISSQNQAKSFVTQPQVLHESDMTCEISLVHLHISQLHSQVAHESLTREMRKKTVLKCSKCQFFKNCLFTLHDFLSQNYQNFSKLN